jgi:hypothetical protein
MRLQTLHPPFALILRNHGLEAETRGGGAVATREVESRNDISGFGRRGRDRGEQSDTAPAAPARRGDGGRC